MAGATGLSLVYRLSSWLLRGVLGFYFTRIERFHAERVPAAGPILFTSNHPNSLTDAFVIGASVPRKVNFVATVQLFRVPPLRWLLSRCGVIAINRVKDDPRAMRTVLDTFEACFRVLEHGEAVGIFPEGITHDDPQLKTVKTGAARMALELEQRHQGKLGLQIVPVGLTFSAKNIYRSVALVHFGEPIWVADFLSRYAEKRHEAIQALTEEIAQGIQGLILHLPNLERARIVEAVERLYLDRLQAGAAVVGQPIAPEADELLLTQRIAGAVEHGFANHPDRAARFVQRLARYEGQLTRLHLSDEVLAHFPGRKKLLGRSLCWLTLGILGAPFALYGWVHRLLPYLVVRWAVRRFSTHPGDKTHVSTASMLAGAVVFTVFYALCAVVFYVFCRWPATWWYALSLPVTSLWAFYYMQKLQQVRAAFRTALVIFRSPSAARRLLAERAELIALIEAERRDTQDAPVSAKGVA